MTSPWLAVLCILGLFLGLLDKARKAVGGLFNKVCVNPLCTRRPDRKHNH